MENMSKEIFDSFDDVDIDIDDDYQTGLCFTPRNALQRHP